MAVAQRAAAQEKGQSLLSQHLRRAGGGRLTLVAPWRTWRLGPEARVAATARSPIAAALDAVFGPMALDPDAPAGGALHLSLAPVDRPGGPPWRLLAGGAAVAHVQTREALAPLLEGALIAHAVKRRDDAVALHAACVERGGKASLIFGPRGAGKSTLSSLLAREGARYLGDELAFVRFEDGTVAPFPKAATIKERGFALFPEGPTHRDPLRGLIRYQPVQTAAVPERLPIAKLFLPRFDAAAPGVELEAISQESLALALVAQCFEGLARDRRTLAAIAALAQVPAVVVRYADPRRAAQSIGEVLPP